MREQNLGGLHRFEDSCRVHVSCLWRYLGVAFHGTIMSQEQDWIIDPTTFAFRQNLPTLHHQIQLLLFQKLMLGFNFFYIFIL